VAGKRRRKKKPPKVGQGRQCRFPSGGEAPGDLWSEKSFANVSEVAGNSRIKM
jgi:hypothetical protein